MHAGGHGPGISQASRCLLLLLDAEHAHGTGHLRHLHGPVLETIARLTAVALRMLEEVGLVARPSASNFWQQAKRSLRGLLQKKAMLQQKEAELQPAHAACREERRLDP